MTPSLQLLLAGLRQNDRLRWGVWVILGIGWLYALLLWDDSIARARADLSQLREQIDRLRPYERGEALWRERAAEARLLHAGLQGLLWEARSRSRAEAAFRDWLQARAKESSLGVRELSVRAQESSASGPDASGGGTGSPPSEAAASAPVAIRARLAVTYQPVQAAALLLGLQSHSRTVTVRRLSIRNPAPPQEAVMELDLQALFVLKEVPQ